MAKKIGKITFLKPETNVIYPRVRNTGSPRLKGVFAKNERGYRLNAIKKRF